MSAFAAGCAICGAELDPRRADRGGRLSVRLPSGQVRNRLNRALDRARVRRS